MSSFKSPIKSASIFRAMQRSFAIIEFNLNGKILHANQKFLSLMNYELKEIKGKYHSIFLEETEAKSQQYTEFWKDLKNGKCFSKTFKRLGKNKKEIWLEATYNPIFNLIGNPYKVIKFATDVTEKSLASLDQLGQIEAIHKSQSVISFNIEGNIIDANQNFLDLFEYNLNEIIGKHHSIFIEDELKNSTEYGEFWTDLRAGIYKASEFKRIGKNNK